MKALRRFFLSLRGKVFLSHLAVLATGMGALILGLYLVAPAFFRKNIHVGGPGRLWQDMLPFWPGGMGPRMGPGGQFLPPNSPEATQAIEALSDSLTSAFLASLRSALWISAGLGVAVALVASIYVSTRVAKRTKQASLAARRIAQGHFHERLNASGHDELAELATDFNRMAESLEDAEERRLQLLSDVAHELRTPLSTVEGYMEGLIDGVVPPTDETFEVVQKESTRMRRLVDDLQKLSVAEAGTTPISPQAVAPASLVQQVVARLEPLFQEKGVELGYQVGSDLPLVFADPDRALQVLLNLLSNALHYTPEGGTVSIQVSVKGEEVLFAVKDTGIGLTEDDAKQVFDRFFRSDRSRSRQRGGTGIGLTIARHLVLAHRGRIWVESPGPNRGATFFFTLPLAEDSLQS